MSEAGDLISRIYSNFRGVDFRGEEINLVRSPDSKNMWRNYRNTQSIETRPGMELHTMFDQPVEGIHFYKDMMIVKSGGSLYKVANGVKTVLKADIYSGSGRPQSEFVSEGFVFGDIFYYKDGYNYFQFDGTTLSDVVGYIPTTSIARKPSGGGTVYEDVNLLSPFRINTFLADGESRTFHLDYVGDIKIVYVKVNGEEVSGSEYGIAQGATVNAVMFKEAPPAPNTDGQDNVEVMFEVLNNDHSDKILKCTLVQVFDNRVFVSGNPDYPNLVWHCSLNDPSYFSDLDYYQEGLDNAKVTSMAAGNNALWVFREPSHTDTSVFYHTPTIDSDYGKIYPSQHSNISTGCIGRAINFNDDIVFISERGLEGISGDITTEQAIAHRSSLVDRLLLQSKQFFKDFQIFAEWEGYLLIINANAVFLADSRATFTNEDHMEYEWFYWDLGKTIYSAMVHEGTLYLGTTDGVYTLTDKTSNVESYWVTPKDKFKEPHRLKTSNKRGCVVEAKGDVAVYAKTEDTAFELIGEYEKVTDYFVSRVKRKKWKDIQLKFHSYTRFSLETATLEAYIGGYIKR